jgi:hypothetical protein
VPSNRLVVAALVWTLLAATTAAFVATEALKLKRPPVGDLRGDRIFSPGCRCPERAARVTIRLREADALDVSILDRSGGTVRVLREGASHSRGRVRLRWNGRDEAGEIVSDGRYRLRVHLADAGRTVTFTRQLVVDTEPPELRVLEAAPTTLEPGDDVELRVELSENARLLLRVDGRPAGRFGPFRHGVRAARWDATVRGQPVVPGVHRLRLIARDLAGNRSRPTRPIRLTVSSQTG